MSQVPSQSALPSGQPAWTKPLLENPHGVADKAARVNVMFSAIAPSYDLNNRLHSLWMDQHWRNVAVKMAGVKHTDIVVDVACGTGDLTLKFAQARFLADPEHPVRTWWGQAPGGGPPFLDMVPVLGRTWWHRNSARVPRNPFYAPETPHVVGVDYTYQMLPIAREKATRSLLPIKAQKGLRRLTDYLPVTFMQGDALGLPLPSASVDIVSIAFGIRNVSDWGKAIDEFVRVLRPGGRLIVLEFSLPRNPVLRGLYNFYFRKIMPRTATLISGDKSGAYKYLPQSVNTFISREAMQEWMAAAGLVEVVARPLTFGICVCYRGVKR